jgi:hypothetical protein
VAGEREAWEDQPIHELDERRNERNTRVQFTYDEKHNEYKIKEAGVCADNQFQQGTPSPVPSPEDSPTPEPSPESPAAAPTPDTHDGWSDYSPYNWSVPLGSVT